MKWIILVAIAIAAASALPEKLPHARAGRRGRQRQHFRQGRQEEAPANLYSVPEEEASPDTGYGSPAADDAAQPQYGAPAVEEEVPEEEVVDEYEAEYEEEEYDELSTNDLGTSYGAPETEGDSSGDALAPPEQATYEGEEQATYNDDQDAAASDDSAALAGSGDDAEVDPLAMLMKSVPGIPGEDYPIFAEAPETAFSCEGQVNGGYYADSEAQCQVFHICAANAEGGLAKYSFLCPNGTIFNQEYFICDWWFNVDCSEAEALAAERNGAIAAEREAVDASNAEAKEQLSADESAVIDTYGAAGEDEEAQNGYGSPLDEAASESLPSYADQPSYSGRRRRF